MLIKYNEKIEIVNSLKDCYKLQNSSGNEELTEAIEYFIENGEDGNLQSELSNLQEELDSYEMSLDSFQRCLLDTLDTVEGLVEEIKEGKRMNREKILDTLNYIIKKINNQI